MKITVLLDRDPADGGDALTLQLMEALTEAGHDVECLVADDELGDDVVKGGVRYHHITFSGAFPALDESGAQLILSSGEMAPHAVRMAGYLDLVCAAVVLDDSPESVVLVESDPAMLIYPSELLRQTLPAGEVPSVVVQTSEEMADELLRSELKGFVQEVQDLLDCATF